MRRSSTPYRVKRLYKIINQWYVKRFIAPQFDTLGSVPEIAHPRSLVIFGRNIHLGKYAQIICASDNCVRFTSWPSKQADAEIIIGDYCLISPGVRISAAKSIRIGDNCMLAANVTISDSDWHGIYNRIRPFRCTKSVVIENNVWLGERVIVNKGVTIGENSVVGAGSVVTKNIPANSVAAGNPARIIKTINPKRRMLKRELLFKNAEHYFYSQDQLDKFMLGNNGWLNWLRSILSPNRND
ncbi:acyltransferase [Cellvibrio fibrivorans]|uniref:Acetyltransferase-like isoleucine patch superfamily enzyme n=1 Tax=Cellvibrio fibrivorans TaxID=126350 RepID=A0ABU1UTD0_9GAMM|nr:acyltransferase [Cellvibrio fibrivorans]MDR7088439.1 acetyltransferase-like isoleucine patch superfamily enzyme [Cellvibrio fibrivorans]